MRSHPERWMGLPLREELYDMKVEGYKKKESQMSKRE